MKIYEKYCLLAYRLTETIYVVKRKKYTFLKR